MDDPDDKVGSLLQATVDTTKKITLGAIQMAGDDAAEALFVALGGVMGALRAAGMVLVPHEELRQRAKAGDLDKTEIALALENMVTDDVLLFAALLACTVITSNDEETMSAKFGPPAYKAALIKFEKLTGRKEVKGLVPALVKAAEEKGDIPFEVGYRKQLN